jgi:TPR repeat protein
MEALHSLESSTSEQERKRSLDLIHALAAEGNIDAQSYLGSFYGTGKYVAQNYETACIWFRRSAESGNRVAQTNLAMMLVNGRGIEKDPQQAFRWYKKAAEQGEPNAQFCLSVMYARGNGTQKNFDSAFQWCRLAAEQGLPKAQSFLGNLYGRKGNREEQVRWLHKAAARDDVTAQYGLGVLYFSGRGVDLNEQTSVEFLQIAAEKGHINAAWELGMRYLLVKSQNKPRTAAYFWLLLATTNGKLKLRKRLFRVALGLTLTKAQRKDADDQVREWNHTHHKLPDSDRQSW